MKTTLLILAVVMGQSVLAADKKPLIANPIVEKAIRNSLNKPAGELTDADLEKVTFLNLQRNYGITDTGLKEVAKLQQLETLMLYSTQITDAGLKDIAKLQWLTKLSLSWTEVTKAGVSHIQKALPKCKIISNVEARAKRRTSAIAQTVLNVKNGIERQRGLGNIGPLTKADYENATTISLYSLGLSEAAVKEIAKCKNLTTLDLRGTEPFTGFFNDPCIDIYLKEVGKLKKLIDLNLVDTKITNESLKEVGKLKNLKCLNLT